MVERLRDEVVGAGLDHASLVLADARGDHDHGQHRCRLIRAQALADCIAVELGHEDVQEHEIRLFRFDDLERGRAVTSGDDVVAFRDQHRLEQSNVLGDVVDDEDLRALALAHAVSPSQ